MRGTAPTGQHAHGVCKELLTAGIPFVVTPESEDIMVSSAWHFDVAERDAGILREALEENGIETSL